MHSSPQRRGGRGEKTNAEEVYPQIAQISADFMQSNLRKSAQSVDISLSFLVFPPRSPRLGGEFLALRAEAVLGAGAKSGEVAAMLIDD